MLLLYILQVFYFQYLENFDYRSAVANCNIFMGKNGEKMIGNDWDKLLSEEFEKPYFKELTDFLEEEYKKRVIYPPKDEIFTALKLTSFADTKVVIIGQDPYHGKGQAHGLCFSVREGIKLPPSLKNIFKELESDIGKPISNSGYLADWAKQGVLMINTVLTVREGEPTSHKGKGWEIFTDAVIEKLNQKQTPIIFLLWGAHAEKKAKLITNPLHQKLISGHPSPLSAYRGFFGCKHFSKTNEILVNNGNTPIKW